MRFIYKINFSKVFEGFPLSFKFSYEHKTRKNSRGAY